MLVWCVLVAHLAFALCADFIFIMCVPLYLFVFPKTQFMWGLWNNWIYAHLGLWNIAPSPSIMGECQTHLISISVSPVSITQDHCLIVAIPTPTFIWSLPCVDFIVYFRMPTLPPSLFTLAPHARVTLNGKLSTRRSRGLAGVVEPRSSTSLLFHPLLRVPTWRVHSTLLPPWS